MNINNNSKGSDYLVDLVGPYKMNRGTMGDHMITIDLNGGDRRAVIYENFC